MYICLAFILIVSFNINRMLRKYGTIKILFLSCFLMGIRILLPIRSGIIWNSFGSTVTRSYIYDYVL